MSKEMNFYDISLDGRNYYDKHTFEKAKELLGKKVLFSLDERDWYGPLKLHMITETEYFGKMSMLFIVGEREKFGCLFIGTCSETYYSKDKGFSFCPYCGESLKGELHG